MTKHPNGRLGNLNASKHAWRAFWKRRALKPADRWVAVLLEDYAAQLTADKGGVENMTTAEQRMLELAEVGRGCTLLILSEAKARGFIKIGKDGSWGVAGGIEALPKFLQLERQCLQALGLERRAKRLPSLPEYMASRAQKPTPESVVVPIASDGTA